MAQLIKFNTEPHKYFAEQKEKFLPLNLILSEKSFELKKNFPTRNKLFKREIAKIIGEYLEKNSKDTLKAHERGSIIKLQGTVADIITLALIWQRNVEHEVKAMIKLSKSIAEIILNTEITPNINLEIQEYLKNNLKEFFYIKLYLQEQDNLPILESLEYFTYEKDPQLKIFINNEEHTIDLKGLNIRRVIYRVIKNFAKFSRNI